MQLVCPHCGQPVTADHINIQRMVAVCPACNTVFQFDPAESKVKHRKVKKPKQITSVESDDGLNIAFRTNFRLDRNDNFIASGFLSMAFSFVTFLLLTQIPTKPQAVPIAVILSLVTLFLYYCFALVAFNKTQIEVDDEQITVSRKPLPNLLSQPNTVALAGVERIRYEETAASKKAGYDMPRYNVWAEMADGSRKIIVSDMIEDYAVFLSQRLNEYLDLETPPDVSRLMDDAEEEASENEPQRHGENTETRSMLR